MEQSSPELHMVTEADLNGVPVTPARPVQHRVASAIFGWKKVCHCAAITAIGLYGVWQSETPVRSPVKEERHHHLRHTLSEVFATFQSSHRWEGPHFLFNLPRGCELGTDISVFLLPPASPAECIDGKIARDADCYRYTFSSRESGKTQDFTVARRHRESGALADNPVSYDAPVQERVVSVQVP